jgi:transposase, IS6 family
VAGLMNSCAAISGFEAPSAARRAISASCAVRVSGVLDELIPSAPHTVERYANNPIETDHGRLKARLRPMRGLKRHRSARVLAAGHAFVQNLRCGHYELATDVPARHRIRESFDQLTMAI